jgi:dTDP-4-amino-4,6-dideoxygalactose transaminase
MNLQLFKPVYHIDECLAEIKICLENNWTGLGFKTVEFEEKWKEYTGFKHAHFLNSATAGLHLAVKIFKQEFEWKDDSEIISTPITFVSTNHAVSYENLHVVFADVDEMLCLDLKYIKNKVTEKTKAVIFMGYGGNIGQYYDVLNFCKENNLIFIFDAAHCAGTRFNGKIVGTEADCTIYSYQAVKPLPTADSGMICFKEEIFDKLARKMSWLGISKDTYLRTSSDGAYKWKYDVEELGFKYHGNSIMAAIGLVELKYLDQGNAYRRQIVNWYNNNFKNEIRHISIIHNCESSCHLYVIEIDNRDEVLLALNQVGIFPGVHYISNTRYKMYSYAKGTCPNAEIIDDRILSLPLHLQLSKSDIDLISENVLRFTYGK